MPLVVLNNWSQLKQIIYFTVEKIKGDINLTITDWPGDTSSYETKHPKEESVGGTRTLDILTYSSKNTGVTYNNNGSFS